MKGKVLLYSLFPALGLLFVTASTASALSLGAFGTLSPTDLASRFTTMLQKEASTLGISVDALKTGWSEGKTLPQIAADNGISADQLKVKLGAARQTQVKAQLQALVDQGVITQAQMDARLAALAAKPAKGKGMGRGHGGFGFGI